jgi:hypothetical protein
MKKTNGNSRLRKLSSGKRSKLEEKVQDILTKIGEVEYESDRIYFTQPAVDRYYIPDFKLSENNYIEVKGRLTLEDRKKMLWVKEQNPNIVIRFIFGNGNNKLTKRSKTTYLDWARQHGFEAIDVSQPVPVSWFNKLETLAKKRKKKLESH